MKSIRIAVVAVLISLLAACASAPSAPKTDLPRHHLTEAELVGKTLYQNQGKPTWKLTLKEGNLADFDYKGVGKTYKDQRWEIVDGDLLVHWVKRDVRLTLYGPDALGRYDFTNPRYPGRIYHLTVGQ